MRHRIPAGLAVALVVLVGGIVAVGVGCRRSDTAPGAAPATAPVMTAAPADARVVNVTCPIMGTKIDPANVPAALTREYKGQKVGFCCGGCPTAWDQLSDAEKDAKLAEAMPKS